MNELVGNENDSPDDAKERERGVLLPCTQEEFGSFISKLLGKPQTIEQNVRGRFELTRADVTNIFNLLDQRIRQQNEANLIQFTAQIYYDDESSVLLTSLSDLVSYSEVKPANTVSLQLSWTYLIKFVSKNSPEKQEINIDFSGSRIRIRRSSFSFRPSMFFELGMRFTIKHTERTWGNDIQSLLKNHLKTLAIEHDKRKYFFWRYSERIGLGVGTLFFLFSIVGLYFTTAKFVNEYRSETIAATPKLDFSLSSDRIDYLISVVTAGVWPTYSVSAIGFMAVSLILALLFGSFAEAKCNNIATSHILFTKDDEKALKKEKDNIARDWKLFLFSLGASVVTGILANILYTKFFAQI